MFTFARLIGRCTSKNWNGSIDRLQPCTRFPNTSNTSTRQISSADSDSPSSIEQKRDNLIEQIQLQEEKLRALKEKLVAVKDNHSGKNGPTPRKLLLRTPTGTRDFNPQQMALRQNVLGKIENIFRKYGAEAIDTPVFETRDILDAQYADDSIDSKLIYDLQDHGGESLSLRYDLTVPLARYLAMIKISTIKCYRIGKVYRRDKPKFSHGRYREFYQCDFDIAGVYDPMLPDAECVKIISDVLNEVDVGKFVIRLNHRSVLDGMFEACGVPADKFRTICSSVDKLDKFAWAEVRKEMTEEKGLDESIADQIGEYIKLSGSTELVDELLKNEHLNKVPAVTKGLKELKLLFSYCKILGLDKEIVLDLSLARGLDYYTGVVYEAVLKSNPVGISTGGSKLGSLVAGGRYDNLVGTFDPGQRVPCVGLSVGFERIFSVLEAKHAAEGITLRTNNADVYVAVTHNGLYETRLKIVNDLWKAGIRTDHSFKLNPRLLRQLQHCEKFNIPFAVVLGENELNRGMVLLRDVQLRKDEEIPLDSLEEEIKKRI